MNKTKILPVFAIAAILIAASTSCERATNQNTTANQPDNKAAMNASPAANMATPATTTAPAADSPTAAYKAAYAARKNKDVPALKKLLSKDMLDFFKMIGNADEKKKQSLDQMLLELCDSPQNPSDDARNEKINGDKATVEYLDEKGAWKTMDFIKEDGAWKLTMDKADKGSPDDDKDDKDNK